jgi:hypothetical protein
VGGNLTGGFAKLDATTGVSTTDQLSASAGIVSTIEKQTDGKVVLGGRFTAIGSVSRTNIARLNVDGTVDATWNPGINVDDDVSVVLPADTVVYVGGEFLNIGGHFRQRLTAIDTITGIATTWQPDPDAPIISLASNGTVVFAGGDFQYIGNARHPYLAALDPQSGLAFDWNPQPDQPILCMAATASSLYVGGYFQSIGGQLRSFVAEVDASTGQATSWSPSNGGQVNVLKVAGNRLYVGGYFSEIGNQARSGIASFDASTGTITDWNPGPQIAGTIVTGVSVSGNYVLLTGGFAEMGRQPRANIAVVDAGTGAANDWDVGSQFFSDSGFPPSITRAIFDEAGGSVYAIGQFDAIGNSSRTGIVALTSPDEIFRGTFE